MFNLRFTVVCVFFVGTFFSDAIGERARDSMYETIKTSAACFRRMNATHQVGCSSDSSGSTGVIHVIESETNLKFILTNGTSPPYVLLMPTSLFTHDIAEQLIKNEKVSGLVLLKQNLTSLIYYSHDRSCPNQFFNLEDTCKTKWNERGTGLLFHDFPFPVFYLDDEKYVTKIRQCFKDFNDFDYETQYQRSLCSLELSSFMFATTDTPTCLRRSNYKKTLNNPKLCDPLGDQNVFASLFPLENKTNTARKFIMVASRMDTTSFFNDRYPGAISSVTSLVTLLSTANLLKKMIPDDKNYDKNVLFMIFHGESYDYIGSQRIVYDMQKGKFPVEYDPNVKNPVAQIRLENISLYLELNQLSNTNNNLVAHVLNDELRDFMQSLRNSNPYVNFTYRVGALPPSSLHSFLRGKNDLAGLVLSDHFEEYANKYFNSIYDNVQNLDYNYYNVSSVNGKEIPQDSIQSFIANVSEMVAKSVFENVTGTKYDGNLTSDIVLVDEMMNCYLLDMNCKIHKAIQKREFKDHSIDFYVGVTGVKRNLLTDLVALALGWIVGDVYETSQNKSCNYNPETPAFQFFHMSKSLEDLNTTVCFKTTMNVTDAVSPAFIIPNYDWKSGNYSSWTESTWHNFKMRMYLRPSKAHERFTLILGCFTLILSVAVVYFVRSKSEILFSTPTVCAPANC